jgi:hypothetical protein
MVELIGTVPALAARNAGNGPVPVGAESPIAGLLFVQLNVVPGNEPVKDVCDTSVPRQ